MRFFVILVRTAEETAAAIPRGLSCSFAWLLQADGLPGRSRHSTSFIAYGYVCHPGLSIEALNVTARFLPHFPRILYNSKSVYLAAPRKLKVSVLSANFKKWRFCNFSRSYAKRSPSEQSSGTTSYSGLVTGAIWLHFS